MSAISYVSKPVFDVVQELGDGTRLLVGRRVMATAYDTSFLSAAKDAAVNAARQAVEGSTLAFGFGADRHRLYVEGIVGEWCEKRAGSEVYEVELTCEVVSDGDSPLIGNFTAVRADLSASDMYGDNDPVVLSYDNTALGMRAIVRRFVDGYTTYENMAPPKNYSLGLYLIDREGVPVVPVFTGRIFDGTVASVRSAAQRLVRISAPE